MIFALPAPLFEQSHVFIERLERFARHANVTILLGRLDARGAFVQPDGDYVREAKRKIGGAEYEAFLRSVASEGAPYGDFRLLDLVRWLVRHGLLESAWSPTSDV